MKILFANRPQHLWVGGDWVQLQNTANELIKLGIKVDILENFGYGYSWYAKQYDIIHTFNFNQIWNEWLKEPKYPDTKYVASMIYQPESGVATDELQKRYDNLDAAIWLTAGEQNRATKDGIVLNSSKNFIIPNGIEEYWFGNPEFRVTKDVTPFVLTVGRLSIHKGQEYVGQACAQLKIPFVSIGGETHHEEGLFHILPNMERDDLKQFYQDCACFVLASRDECQPITVMEAGAQAKNIVLTENCEWELPHIDKCKYGDVISIKNAITKSIKKPPNYPLQSMLKKMTWKKVAEDLVDVYKKILK